MSDDDLLHDYLIVADDLFNGRILETDLPDRVLNLPTPDRPIIDQLAQQAEEVSTTRPKYGWAITHVGYAAALARDADLFVRSLAAWYLARASNHWAQPKRAGAAASLARRGFEELADFGWIASCDWQYNALAWTQPNFAVAAQALKEALSILEGSGFGEFIPDCRLSLSYAQILIGEHDDALENIRLSEQIYLQGNDPLNQARCWLHQASSLRRRGHFGQALEKLQAALSVFVKLNSLTDQGKAHYQIAVGHMLQADDLEMGIEHFRKAAAIFEETDLELWQAMSMNSLGAVYMSNGRLKEAEQHYQNAQGIFWVHDIPGLLADNLNDSGKLNVLMGRLAESVEQLKKALQINEQLGAGLSGAVVLANLGEAYGQLGRYQDALVHLERTVDRLEEHKAYFRMATCEKYMAAIWSRLGRTELAHDCLDKAAVHYETAHQHAWLSSVHNYRAATYFQERKTAETIRSLERSLEVSKTYGLRPQSALAMRLLGDAWIQNAGSEEALRHLNAAQAEFIEMGMSMEQAACLVSIASYYASISETSRAQQTFEEALRLSEGSFPEIDWRAHMELGKLSEIEGNVELTLTHFQRSIDALQKIRANFLQPALAGSYLYTPASAFDHIVSFASNAGVVSEALHFIEESKASTLLRNLMSNQSSRRNEESRELIERRDEIKQLKNRLRVSPSEVHPLQSAVELRQVRTELKNKIELFEVLKSRLERKNLQTELLTETRSFDLTRFRGYASTALKGNWTALDYFMTKDELIAVLITAQETQLYRQPISARFEMALAGCERARRNAEPLLRSDLEALGKILLPDALMGQLAPDTYLLIAPHRKLHQIPWPALCHPSMEGPLVGICTPTVIPSLGSLELLWERNHSVQNIVSERGLLVGLSAFHGLHSELPLIREEVKALAALMGSDGRVLAEEDATWQNLIHLKTETGLSNFGWLHIASHFFSDRHTGRLSGIALHDREIFLDELRDLAPLPNLVSLSACNSNDSFLFEGDERFDLQTTCFLAGANTVIGSSWPVLDTSTAELTAGFFEYYLSGLSPSQAAAQVQRRFIERDQPMETWASFLCAGVP